jgi:hypothetical protein
MPLDDVYRNEAGSKEHIGNKFHQEETPEAPKANAPDEMESISLNDVNLYSEPIKFDPKNWARDKHFSTDVAGNKISRFMTYGSEIYGDFGFDPYRDNNEWYNEHTDSSVDLGRAWDGMWKLASVGFTDTFGFGAFGEEENHKDFGKIMEDYSSTRHGTWTGFFSNATLSAGYTVGIISAMVAEEALLLAGTLATGGMGAPATGTAAANTAGRGFYKMRKAWNFFDKVGDHVNVFKKMRNIENARAWYNPARYGASLLKGVGQAGKAWRPLGNVGDFARSLDKADGLGDATNLAKVFQGSAAFARDARKFYLAHSESRLESNFVKDEIIEESMDQWFAKNPGQEMSDEVYQDIINRGVQAYEKAYGANFALIYTTNGLLFDGLFKGFNP